MSQKSECTIVHSGLLDIFTLYSKMRHLKKIRETDAGPIDFHWFHNFFRHFIFEFFFFTNGDVVAVKDETSK